MTTLYIVLAVALVALIVLLIVFLIQRKKKKKAEAAQYGGDQQDSGADEISQLIRDADAKIGAAKMQAGARVSTLPAFLLIGDPGSTKTSVMLHSGLDPELMAGQVYQGGNVAPTRTANFWFSRRSVFVEAGGRLPTETPKWNKLVNRLVPRTSVVGKGEQAPRAAIVCYDIENFTKPGAADMAATAARTLRSRLGELSQSMGIQLPVYVLFTRADRLPFFTEYVRNLTNEESTQVVGVTLPMIHGRNEGIYAEQESARLTGNFERLFRSLADARPEFLSRETDPTKLPAAYEFPREFRKLRPTVVQFLVDLCRPSQLTVGPFLRGFYFTGVRPIIINDAAPVQAAQQQQAGYGQVHGATGIFNVGAMQGGQPAQSPVAQTRKVPQWLFLGHLFNDVLLADGAAMGASGASTKTSFWRRFLLASVAGLCFLLLACFTISFFNNRALENKVKDAAVGISSVDSAGGGLASVESLRKLDALREAMAKLVDFHRNGRPLFYRFFLYIGDDLYVEARRVYFDRFKLLLFGQTQTRILDRLRTLPSTAGDPEYTPTYNALKAYLITTSFHDKSTKQFLSPVLMDWWKAGRTIETDRSQLAQKQFDFYSDELFESNPYNSDNDTQAITHARTYLAQFAGAQRVYAYMLSECAKSNPPVDFHKMYPGSEQVVREPHIVPGAFSKTGWAFMKDAIAHPDKYYSGEKWVLGEQGTGNIDLGQLANDVKGLYYRDFTNEWRTYIKSASVVRYAGLKDASDKLKMLSSNTSPLLQLIAVASRNTDVDDPAVKNLFQPPQSVVPPANTDVVIAGPNQPYMQALTALQTNIEQIAATPGTPSDSAAAPALDSARQATGNARQIEQGFRPDNEGGVDKKVGSLLEDPITYVQGILRAFGPKEINDKGAGMCGALNSVMKKYPFNPKATDQATLSDVSDLFRPKEGLIWQTYESAFSKLITRAGSQFAAAPGASMPVNPRFVEFLNNAAGFSNLVFPNGSADPQFKYTVTAASPWSADIEKVTLVIDGVSATLAPGTPGKTYTWPGTTSRSVQLSYQQKGSTSPNGLASYDGLWSVVKLIQDNDPSRSGTKVDLRVLNGRGQPVTGPSGPLFVRLDFNPNPFSFFSGMGCVSTVVSQ